MNPSEQRILLLYKKDANSVLSTTDILKGVDPETYEKIESVLKDSHSTKDSLKEAKREKAKLHRKLLYYLTKLVKEGVLKIVKEGSKGEKFFTLSLEEGEELVVEKYKKRQITISKPRTPATPTEGYEQSGIVAKVEEPTWIDRLNCLLCEGKFISNIEKLFGIINNSFSLVNDCIGINNFELFVEISKEDELISYLDKLDDDCRDFGKKVSLIVDVENISENNKFISFVRSFSTSKYVNINIIFEMNPNSIHADSSFFETIIKIISQNGTSLFIKNTSLVRSPYCIGKGGIYNFHEDDWKDYCNSFRGSLSCLSCGQSSLSVDVKKYYDKYGFSNDSFERFIINCAESLLSANSIQRRKAAEFFDYLVELNQPDAQHAFMFSRNYIRFLNYDFFNDKFGFDFTIDLLKRVKTKIYDFTFSEETIYKSCGMPTRFKIVIGSNVFTESNIVKQNEDLQNSQVKKNINFCEKKSDVLDGNLVVEFVRTGNTNIQDVAREWIQLLTSYKLPVFVYRFKRSEGVDLKLDEFLGGKK